MRVNGRILAVGLAGALVGGALVYASVSLPGLGPIDAVAAAQSQQATPVPQATQRGYLGVMLADVSGKLTEQFGLKTSVGAVIVGVVPDSPAARAGLQKGDVITAVNGAAVNNVPQTIEAIRQLKPGDSVRLSINRGGASQEVTATLGEVPQRGARSPANVPGPGPLKGLGRLSEGQLTFVDENGQRVTVTVTGGEVVRASASSLTVKPRGSDAERTFQVTANTVARVGEGGVAGLQPGDQVLVVTRDDPNTAAFVVRGGRAHWKGFPFQGGRGVDLRAFGLRGLRVQGPGPVRLAPEPGPAGDRL